MAKIRSTPKPPAPPRHPSTAGLGLTREVRQTVREWCHSSQMDGTLYLALEADGIPCAQIVPRGTQAHLVSPRPRWWHYATPYAWAAAAGRAARVEDLQRALDHLSAEST